MAASASKPRRSFRVVRLGSIPGKVSFVNFGGRPSARYRWSWKHEAWIRSPMPPRFVLEDQPDFPAVIRARPRAVD